MHFCDTSLAHSEGSALAFPGGRKAAALYEQPAPSRYLHADAGFSIVTRA